MTKDYYLWMTRRRLIHWGRWSQQIAAMGLDYANQSLDGRLQKEGGVIIPSTTPQIVPHNPEAEEVNDWLERLAQAEPTGYGKPDWVEVIRIHYTMAHRSTSSRIQTSGLTKRTYYYYLKQAEIWLSHRLLIHPPQ